MSTQESPQPATTFVLRDPETFFHAQKRNRRATWRMSALGVFAAFIMGIPLTLALTPLFYAGTLLVAEIVNHFSPLPPEFWQQANSLARLASRLADFLFNHKGTLDPQELVQALAIVLLPGMAIAFFLWTGMMVLFRRGGVGGALASLAAREPNPADLKELQLADTAQEMAIAAGLPAPKLMLVDSPGANAAAIGTSVHDARIVISRRLIDDLSRDQLQALLGHLIGSIGNGDLRIAFTVTSVFETCGLLVTLINSPFGSHSRSTLWRMFRYALFRSSDKAAEADAVCELLGGSMDAGSDDISRFFDSSQHAGPIRKLLRFIFFPILFTNISIEMTLWFFLSLLVGPCMALVWRTRRYLADASSVELTRNPDALAGALERLAQDNSAIPGGGWATHLFVINPTGDHSLGATQPSQEQMRQAAAIWATASGTSAASVPTDYTAFKREIMKSGVAAMQGDTAAAAKMQTFVQAMAAAHGEDASEIHMPNLADLAAARQGDRAAIARLRAVSQQRTARQEAKSGSSGLQGSSFLSFHPPLKKRLKRLERMGAHLAAGAPRKSSFAGKMILGVLLLIIVPLLALAAGMMLVVIAMMIGLNLVILAIWMAVIHAIFVWWNKGS
ncbi:MAG TPA: M48 family metalloprotease [Candidatus Angelobacter sp.]|nr:M48 family metalloprotease [Candidatus Angelobacter sp.]